MSFSIGFPSDIIISHLRKLNFSPNTSRTVCLLRWHAQFAVTIGAVEANSSQYFHEKHLSSIRGLVAVTIGVACSALQV